LVVPEALEVGGEGADVGGGPGGGEEEVPAVVEVEGYEFGVGVGIFLVV
jgi:hypothetical protein